MRWLHPRNRWFLSWFVVLLLLGLTPAGHPVAPQPRAFARPPANPAPASPIPATAVASATPGVTLTPIFTPTATPGPTTTPSPSPPAPQPRPVIRLSLAATPAEVAPGDVLTYTLRLSNAGPARVTRLVISDTLPVGLVYVPGSAGSGQYDPPTRRLTWSLEALDVRTEATFSFQARVTGRAANPLPNTVEASSPDLRGRPTATTWVHVRHTAAQVVRPGAPARLTAPGGRVWLDFPAGAVTETLRVRYQSLAARRLAPRRSGLALQFELTARPANNSHAPPITRFRQPLHLTVDLTGLVDALGPYQTWFVGYRDARTGRWVPLPVVTSRPGPVLTVEVDHFTPFGAGTQHEYESGWVLPFNPAQVALFDGAFTYTYPIAVPPGRGGLTPRLALAYNSRRVDGIRSWVQADWAGLGWSVDTVEIVRKLTPSSNWRWANSTYENRFTLLFNGAAYKLEPASAGQYYGRYHTADEQFRFIERRNVPWCANRGGCTPDEEAANLTREYWVVKAKDGTVYRLGYNIDSEQVAVAAGLYAWSGGVPPQDEGYAGEVEDRVAFRWRLDRIVDPQGNRIEFHYQEAQYGYDTEPPADRDRASYLHQVCYNPIPLTGGAERCGNRVLFLRGQRGTAPDTVPDWEGDAAGQGPWRFYFYQRDYLGSIQVQFWNTNSLTYTILSEYVLTYDEQTQPEGHNNHTRRLKRITPYGRGGAQTGPALPATTFDYQVYPNKGICYWFWGGACTDGLHDEWDQEAFRYERLSGVDNGYAGVITTTYQTPDGSINQGYWQTKNYRVARRQTQDRGAVVREVAYAYPDDVNDRCYDENDDRVCDDPAGFGGGPSGGRLVGYKTVTETLKTGAGSNVAITEHDFWLRDVISPTFALGREVETRVIDPAGPTPLQTVQRTYSDDTAGRPAGVHFMRLERVDRYAGDTTGPHSRTEYSYDAYGNLTREYRAGDVDDSTDDRTVFYTYNPNPTDWIVDRMARESVYVGNNAADDSNTTYLKARTRYHYDLIDPNDPLSDPRAWTDPPTAGLLTQVDAWNGGLTGNESQDFSITGYRYDAFGNRIRVTDPLSRTTTTEYDGLFHSYPITHTTALGQTTLTQYYGVNGAPATGSGAFFGQVESVSDANGATTRYTYDGFGRPATVRRPGDESGPATVQYSYTDGPLFRVQMDRRQDGSTVRTSYRFYDGLGRLIESKEPLPNSQQAVQHTAYDARRQVAREYVPYAVPTGAGYVPEDTGKPHTGYAYDGLSRPTLLSHPDGRTVQTSYAGWRTTVVDENGHQRVHERDGYGRLVRVEEYTGTGPYTLYATTVYTYSVLDRLTGVQDAAANTTTIEYDPLGRKVRLVDPDMGAWEYRYDAAGNLVKQRDGRNRAICFYYDALNRPAGKSYHAGVTDLDTLTCPGPPYAVRYDYDDGANGVGRRTGMSDGSGTTTWSYDARGRVVTETRTIGALGAYTTTYGYDSQDRVVGMRYPDPTPDGVETGELITTTYNAAGWPATLTGSLGDTYVSASTYNAQGQPKTIQLGGGLVTRFGYYGYNGWGMGDGDDAPDHSWANVHVGKLWKLCTVPAGQACPQAGNSSSVLDLRYSYDGVGNITSLRDRTGGGDELQTFAYDDLDRLTAVSGAYSAGYTYDAIGNLLTKTEDGVAYTLQYTDPLHVHAPKVVNGTTYTYDATGNLTARAGDSLTYDAESRLHSVTTAGETVTFTYDGDGRRVLRDAITGTIAYVGPHYELRFNY